MSEANMHWQDVRRAALDDWSTPSKFYPQEHIYCNNEVHGGNILADIEAIRDQKRARGWKAAFRASYGVTFNKIFQLRDARKQGDAFFSILP